jgi:hypothetical protein
MDKAESTSEGPTPLDEGTSNGRGGNGNGASDGVYDRIVELATASVLPEVKARLDPDMTVESAEGLRATFPGQGTEAGDQLISEHAEAALQAAKRARAARGSD